ncbi:MAG: tRNA pseudouridine(13) synthase TruD [Thermosulfidibacteraceae bacterium]|jgi:tRNA pseudouridine13 synthase
MLYKSQPEDFLVEEIPLYQFTRKGEHVILKIKKRNLTTFDVIKQIASFLKIPEKLIGYAGLKDKVSVSIQHISIPKNILGEKLDTLRKHLEERGISVLDITEHRNKLRPGHLKGNIFTIKVKEVDNVEKVLSKLRELERYGILNYFDEQRFGKDNIEKAISLLKEEQNKKINPYKKRLLVSSLTSLIFNEYVDERLNRELVRVLKGDIIFDQKSFKLGKAKEESEITINTIPTGPIWGSHMIEPENDILREIEYRILEKYGLKKGDFRKLKNKGTRRPIKVYPEMLDVVEVRKKELTIRFFLPKGSYATLILKELERVN